MANTTARVLAERVKHDLSSMRIITLDLVDELQSALHKVHKATLGLADAIVELSR
jgi:hypothetical protein